ncbi:MAG: hypothetical protein KKB51_22875 [Candidatus Riflebacteria bacterium]|nr:hypothetical protein [Candidatus Riflebacteria bacterium]
MTGPMVIFRLRTAFSCLLLFAFILGFPMDILGAEYKAGPYLIDVDVRTSLTQVIPNPHVTCRLSGKVIKVSASAPGYFAQTHEISVKPGIMSYSAMIRLSDKQPRLSVEDFNYKPIVSAYFDRYQGNTPGELYAINLYLPIKSWPHANPANIIVNQPGYGWPIQQTCEISVFEDFYWVRMLIDRAVLDDPKNELLIYVNTAEVISVSAAEKWLETIVRLESAGHPGVEQLAFILTPLLPAEISAEALPDAVSRQIANRRRFSTLHRD